LLSSGSIFVTTASPAKPRWAIRISTGAADADGGTMAAVNRAMNVERTARNHIEAPGILGQVLAALSVPWGDIRLTRQ
jgi:hypothetical protein